MVVVPRVDPSLPGRRPSVSSPNCRSSGGWACCWPAGAVVWELRRAVPRWPAMVVGLAALALVLHGTLPAVESVPRFSTAYTVAGFSEYLGRTGHAPAAARREDVVAGHVRGRRHGRPGHGGEHPVVPPLVPARVEPGLPDPPQGHRQHLPPHPACPVGSPRPVRGRQLDRSGLLLPPGPQSVPVPGGRGHRHPGVQRRRVPTAPRRLRPPDPSVGRRQAGCPAHRQAALRRGGGRAARPRDHIPSPRGTARRAPPRPRVRPPCPTRSPRPPCASCSSGWPSPVGPGSACSGCSWPASCGRGCPGRAMPTGRTIWPRCSARPGTSVRR